MRIARAGARAETSFGEGISWSWTKLRKSTMKQPDVVANSLSVPVAETRKGSRCSWRPNRDYVQDEVCKDSQKCAVGRLREQRTVVRTPHSPARSSIGASTLLFKLANGRQLPIIALPPTAGCTVIEPCGSATHQYQRKCRLSAK